LAFLPKLQLVFAKNDYAIGYWKKMIFSPEIGKIA
jgi:hypothetical protein